MDNLKIAAIGGGTGLSTLLRGLKKYSGNITAIVNVADDGGSSGKLRDELGVLPPGDIRNCLVALSEEESMMSRLFQYRFPAKGTLSGHSFGNLFLTAMSSISGSFDSAIANSGEVLAIRGKVLPVTLSSVVLEADLENGKKISGESNIGKVKERIKTITLNPAFPPAAPQVLETLKNADVIILGPGSLYTSIIVNLLVGGVADALKSSKAYKIYVCNIMTQPGETKDYTLSDHVRAIEEHTYKGVIDCILASSGEVPENLVKRYRKYGADQVKINKTGVKTIKSKLFSDEKYARHDSDKLAKTLIKIIKEKSGIKDNKND
ncbi:MAG: YvcK family protein [Endomicrobia bacterium]|nr:YvcK family protein [Endomicrobiia bacterium]MCL2507244.1 YvcK family protein [Endomicrobiia bacterium]